MSSMAPTPPRKNAGYLNSSTWFRRCPRDNVELAMMFAGCPEKPRSPPSARGHGLGAAIASPARLSEASAARRHRRRCRPSRTPARRRADRDPRTPHLGETPGVSVRTNEPRQDDIMFTHTRRWRTYAHRQSRARGRSRGRRRRGRSGVAKTAWPETLARPRRRGRERALVTFATPGPALRTSGSRSCALADHLASRSHRLAAVCPLGVGPGPAVERFTSPDVRFLPACPLGWKSPGAGRARRGGSVLSPGGAGRRS